MSSKIVLVTGGARSGKSSFAERLATEESKKVAYIATGEPFDKEMKIRIQKHKDRRPVHWETYEEPIEVNQLVQRLGLEREIIIIDCLTLLTSNLLLREEDKIGDPIWEEEVLSEIKKITESCYKVNAQVIIVSNEIGMGLVPDNLLGRFYRDILGRANHVIAGKADEVFLMVSGIPLKIKGK